MASIKEIQDRADKINELTNAVQLKNRIVDGRVMIPFDGRPVVFEPGEVKLLPRKVAEWLRNKSLYCFNPGDVVNDIPAKSHYKLAILEDPTQDATDLTRAEVAEVKELLDRSSMPELTRVDPLTGRPMRAVYIDPRSTGARDTAAIRQQRATSQVSHAIVEHAAEAIAEAAQKVSDREIDAAVAEFARDAAGPAGE